MLDVDKRIEIPIKTIESPLVPPGTLYFVNPKSIVIDGKHPTEEDFTQPSLFDRLRKEKDATTEAIRDPPG